MKQCEKERFINIFKNSAVKTVKTNTKIIGIITVKNTVIQNALQVQIKNKYKNTQNISNIFKVLLKKASLDVRFWMLEIEGWQEYINLQWRKEKMYWAVELFWIIEKLYTIWNVF